jgi:glyoxylase-like metal-dependent hydrolase (beta-lactamase superfamily II)
MVASLFLEVFPTGPLQANCILVGDKEAGILAVVDPGEEASLIAGRIEKSGLEPRFILHTHGHFDHAGGTAELSRLLGAEVPVGLHPDELELYRNMPVHGLIFGFEIEEPPDPNLELEHGQSIELGGISLEVRHTPGHSPGGVAFVVHGGPETVVIGGDLLFASGVGRTDLPGGSFQVLATSIHEQLFSLPDDTRVICGHGPDTTTGHEKRTNPFVGESSPYLRGF